MNIAEFRDTIKRREYVAEISSDEWQEGIEQCWKKEIALMMEDVPSAVDFLRNDCTEDEFAWLSEVIDDIAARSEGRQIVDAYKGLIAKYPDAGREYHIADIVEKYTRTIVPGEASNGKNG